MAYAQKLAIDVNLCANTEIVGTVEEILNTLATQYPQCFIYERYPSKQKSFRVKLGGKNLCIAEFVRIGREWVPRKSPDNPILCISDASLSLEPSNKLVGCPVKLLRRLGWRK